MTVHFSPTELERFGKALLIKLGFPTQHSEIISQSLVLANLRGVDSHGVVRLAYYSDGVEKGSINPKPNIKIVKENQYFTLIDGDNTLGYVPATLATEKAILKAKEYGIGISGVRNLKHSGMLAKYVMQAVEEKMFALAIANASPNIALPGFKKPVVGTNPLAIGFPVDGSTPIILDMAMSVVARGKLLVASKKGAPIPKGWALNENGEETTDANEAIKGMLLPIGGYKGFGLAIVIDILCGIVLGGGYGLKIQRSWFSQGGFLILVSKLDIARPYEEYLNDIKEYIREMKSTPVSEGTRILFPNEIEEELTCKRMKEGIPLDDETVSELIKLAKKYDVAEPKCL